MSSNKNNNKKNTPQRRKKNSMKEYRRESKFRFSQKSRDLKMEKRLASKVCVCVCVCVRARARAWVSNRGQR